MGSEAVPVRRSADSYGPIARPEPLGQAGGRDTEESGELRSSRPYELPAGLYLCLLRWCFQRLAGKFAVRSQLKQLLYNDGGGRPIGESRNQALVAVLLNVNDLHRACHGRRVPPS